jgi:diguanylate cyclase (GGDEF)-like protein
LLDVDHFKQFNDNFGHDAGDRALRHVAEILRTNCRGDVELLFRVGGEEFAILCQGRLSSHTLHSFGERINQAFRASPPSGVAAKALTVSIGGAIPIGADETWEGLYKRADSALYAAKNKGRDRTVIAMDNAIFAAG